MPRIPEFPDDRVRVNLPRTAPFGGGYGEISDALREIAPLVQNLASAEAKKKLGAAKQNALAREKIQQVADVMEAQKRSTVFNQMSLDTVVGVQRQFPDDPDKWVDEYMKVIQQDAEREVQNAPNSAQGLILARETNQTIGSHLADLNRQVSLRKVQKIRVGSSDDLQTAATGAKDRTSLDGLADYQAEVWKKQGATLQFTNSPEEASTKWKHFLTESAENYANRRIEKDPANFLRNDWPKSTGPLAVLSASKRQSLFESAKMSFMGSLNRKRVDSLLDGAQRDSDSFDGLLGRNGKTWTPETGVEQIRNSLAERELVENDPDYREVPGLTETDAERVRAEKAERLRLIDDKIEYVKAMTYMWQKNNPNTSVGDPAVEEDFRNRYLALTKKGAKADYADAVKLTTDIMRRIGDERLSPGAGRNMLDQIHRVKPGARGREEGDTWGYHPTQRLWWGSQTAREAGNAEMGRLMRGYKTQPIVRQNAAWDFYMETLTRLEDEGMSLTKDATIKAAREAVKQKFGSPSVGRP